jgi:hypothetical protein
MTFDDDMISLMTPTGQRRIPVKALGLEWPPPETLTISGVQYQRVRYSQIPDEARQGMSHVIRGAEYTPV